MFFFNVAGGYIFYVTIHTNPLRTDAAIGFDNLISVVGLFFGGRGKNEIFYWHCFAVYVIFNFNSFFGGVEKKQQFRI